MTMVFGNVDWASIISYSNFIVTIFSAPRPSLFSLRLSFLLCVSLGRQTYTMWWLFFSLFCCFNLDIVIRLNFKVSVLFVIWLPNRTRHLYKEFPRNHCLSSGLLSSLLITLKDYYKSSYTNDLRAVFCFVRFEPSTQLYWLQSTQVTPDLLKAENLAF